MSNKTRISEHFFLEEFKGVNPHPDLLFLLERIRVEAGCSIHITDSTRTPAEHVATYKKLSDTKKLKTKENKLSTTPLMDLIPWGSRHLADYRPFVVKNKEWNTRSSLLLGKLMGSWLKAVDFQILKKDGTPYSGIDMENIIRKVRPPEISIGLGVGHTYCHLDVDREVDAAWTYGY